MPAPKIFLGVVPRNTPYCGLFFRITPLGMVLPSGSGFTLWGGLQNHKVGLIVWHGGSLTFRGWFPTRITDKYGCESLENAAMVLIL